MGTAASKATQKTARVTTAPAEKPKTSSNAGGKRKRLIDDEDNNRNINSMFKRVRKDEYDEATRRELQSSSQSPTSRHSKVTQVSAGERGLGEEHSHRRGGHIQHTFKVISQAQYEGDIQHQLQNSHKGPALNDNSDNGPNVIDMESVYSTVSHNQDPIPKSKAVPISILPMSKAFAKAPQAEIHPETNHHLMQLESITPLSTGGTIPNLPAPLPRTSSTKPSSSLATVRERRIILLERRLLQAYKSSELLKETIEDTNPRELISCMSRMAIDHLVKRHYDINKIMRAVAMAHGGMHNDVVEGAWKCAQTGKVFPLAMVTPETGGPFDNKTMWETWKTDAEALELVDRPIESVGLNQLQVVLRFSYKLAFRLTWEEVFSEQFLLLIHIMRYMAREGYYLEPIMTAMALEMRGEGIGRVEAAWQAARGIDV